MTTKPSRRANRESTIYQDDAGVWHGWVTVGTLPDGRPDRRHRRAKSRPLIVAKVRFLAADQLVFL